MKHLILITCIALLPVAPVVAEESAKSLASTLEIYVFPAAGQASDQQSKDEAEATGCSNSECDSGCWSERRRQRCRSRRVDWRSVRWRCW